MDNIIEVTVGTFRCPEALKNKDRNISSFRDRVAWSVEKYKALNEAISPSSTAEGMRIEIGDFFCAFATRNECETEAETNDAAAGATIMTVTGMNLFEMDFTQCERIIDAMAVERRRSDATFRELGEKAMTTFMRVCEQFASTV